jgi:hypothetical protein
MAQSDMFITIRGILGDACKLFIVKDLRRQGVAKVFQVFHFLEAG